MSNQRQGTGDVGGELNECGQKVQIFCFKINKYQECNTQHDEYS